MNLFLIFTTILIAASASGYRPLARITGGDYAKESVFPYQVGLRLSLYDGTTHHMCTGTVLNNEWILTAAHCTKNTTSLIVFLGAIDIRKPEVTYLIDRADFVIHSDFSWETLKSDIALIKIPFTAYSPNIQPIQLAKDDVEVGTEVVAVGWGKESDKNEEYATNLKWTTLQTASSDECTDVYKLYKEDKHYCVATANGISTCNGDSGGPLLLNSTGLQIGLTSFGHRYGCTKNYPVVFTRLNKFLDWIKDNSGLTF